MRDSTRDLASELLEHLSEAQPPEVVYHYTTPKGLLGIFASKSLWCTDIRFLNDAREVAFTLEFARDLLEGRLAKAAGPKSVLYDRWRRNLWTLSDYPTFVTSFSEHDDLLSQWRAYSAPTGFAVGFLSSRLASLADSYPLPGRLIRCVYDVAEQRRHIEMAIDQIGTAYDERGSDARADHTCTRDFFRFILVAAAAFKHPKFSEEKEWRLVIHGLGRQVDEVGGVRRHFRPGPHTIIPYVDFPITSGADPLAIKVIVAGPGPMMTLTGEALANLMEQSNLPPDALMAVSTIPYPNW